MSGIATAVVAAAVVGGVAANSAAKKQAGAAGRALSVEQQQYEDQVARQAPWTTAGEQSLRQLSIGLGNEYKPQQTAANFDAKAYLAKYPGVAADPYYGSHPYEHFINSGYNEGAEFTYTPEAQAQLAGKGAAGFGDFNRDFTMADFQKDPGYDFRLNQGLDAVQGSRAAKGSMFSGSTLKALSDYGSNVASGEYGKAYDRFNNDRAQRFNRLSTVAGLGQTATNNVGTAGANFANAASNSITGAGNASASGTVGAANAISNGASNLQSLYQLNRIFPNKTASTLPSGVYQSGAYGGGVDGTAQLPWGG